MYTPYVTRVQESWRNPTQSSEPGVQTESYLEEFIKCLKLTKVVVVVPSILQSRLDSDLSSTDGKEGETTKKEGGPLSSRSLVCRLGERIRFVSRRVCTTSHLQWKKKKSIRRVTNDGGRTRKGNDFAGLTKYSESRRNVRRGEWVNVVGWRVSAKNLVSLSNLLNVVM